MNDSARLVWCAPIDEPTGYADEARGLLTAFEGLSLPVALRPAGTADESFRASLAMPVRDALATQQQRGLARPLVLVQHYPADGFMRAAGMDWQVGRTMFETDGLPASWVAQCNSLDEIWVPSRFNVETFRRAGVTVPITRVPGGVDVTHFTADAAPIDVARLRGTVFLGVFEWAHRKGWDVLIRAWAEAFTPDDDVTLVLRTRIRSAARRAGHPEAGAQLDAFLQSALQRTRADLAPIVLLEETIADAHLPGLYTRANALVAPSRGEGWGRPLMEAMACGTPVIATRWSAPLDFLHDDYSLLLDVPRLEPARDDVFDLYDGQQWAEPSVAHLVELLRRVHTDPGEARRMGVRAREAMVADWTWAHAAQVAAARLTELQTELQSELRTELRDNARPAGPGVAVAPTTGAQASLELRAEESDPPLDTVIAQVRRWCETGEQERAIAALQRALVQWPQSVEVPLELASLAATQRDVRAEREWLAEAVRRNPRHVETRRRACRASLRDDDADAACGHARSWLELEPGAVDAWLQLAIAELQLPGRRDVALEAFARARAIAPDHADVRALARALHTFAPEGPQVSIVVPVHGQVAFTAACLEALEATLPPQLGVEVIVVDDASPDSTAAFLDAATRRWSWLRVVHLPHNVGFSGACNAGAEAARGRWLHFLNNDTTPQPGWLEALLAAAEVDPTVGIVGSLLVFPPLAPGAPLRVQHAGIAFREDRTSTHLYKFCYADLPFLRQRRECQAVTGASLLVARDLFEDIGGFDLGYRNGSEDLELCFAARARGRRVVMAPDSVIWHHESATLVVGHRSTDANYQRFLTRWRDTIVPDEESIEAADGLGRAGRPRIAMVTPLAPVRSGVSDVVRELAEVLADTAQIEFITADVFPSDPWITDRHHVYSAHDFGSVWDLRRPDVVFLHLGNNPYHQRMAQIARSVPTVIVLHEYDVRGTGGAHSSREHLQQLFEHAIAVVVHNAHARSVVQEEFPALPVHVVPLTVPSALLAPQSGDEARRAAARRRLGVPHGTFLIVSLGLVQFHKRNHVAIEAMARVAAQHPGAQLVLAGEAPEQAYAAALDRLAADLGVSDRVHLTGWIDDDAFLDWLAAADVTVNLRYPARGEESASLTRILASGRPACVSDYAQFADLPRHAVLHIPFEDEVRHLAAALIQLGESVERRQALGDAARAHVEATGSPERIARAYGEIIRSASTVTDADRLLRRPGYAHRAADGAAVLWQAPWDRVSDPSRHLALGLDARGVELRVEHGRATRHRDADREAGREAEINAADRARLGELERRPLEAEYIQVYAGPVAGWLRHDRAHTAVVSLLDAPLAEFAGWARRPVDEFWVPSRFAAEQLAANGVPAARIAVVPAAVPGFLYRTHVHENRPAGPCRLLAVTDWSTASGWESLLRAWLRARREVPTLTLTLRTRDGDDDAATRDTRFAEALMGFMTRHPEFSHDEYLELQHDGRTVPENLLPNAYALANAVVCPGTEATGGRVALEAMALGLPVVLADAGAHGELAGDGDAADGHAFRVPVRQVDGVPRVDEDALAATLVRLARDRVATQTPGIMGRQHVLGHRTWRHSVDQVHERLRTLAMRPDRTATRPPRAMVTTT